MRRQNLKGTLSRMTNELQAILVGIQNTSTFRQMMHLEHVSYDKKLFQFRISIWTFIKETKSTLATFRLKMV